MALRLILVPTALELQLMRERFASPTDEILIELCGFGPIASAARTAALLARWQPANVLLLGIAGALDRQLIVGSAYSFSQVACYGVGIGSGTNFQTVEEAGWMHWPKNPSIGDQIEVMNTSIRDRPSSGQLLSVCAAASCQTDVDLRRKKFPTAVAEDMEGFAVAMACRLADVPLRIVRGISNVAGDRDHENWRIAEAIQSAMQLAKQILEQ